MSPNAGSATFATVADRHLEGTCRVGCCGGWCAWLRSRPTRGDIALGNTLGKDAGVDGREDELTAASMGMPWTPTMPQRVVGGLLLSLVVALVVGYAVLWLGGAAEAVAYDLAPDGPTCVFYFDSGSDIGDEGAQWIGGGMLGRPGRVCQLGDFAQKQLTAFDVISAAMAGLAFAFTTVFLSRRWAARR